MLDGDRNSGRTWRQLEALPDGSIFLVHSDAMVRYCRSLLGQMGRRGSALRFATPDNFYRLEGARVRADVDHAYDFASSGPRAQEARAFVMCIAATQP